MKQKKKIGKKDRLKERKKEKRKEKYGSHSTTSATRSSFTAGADSRSSEFAAFSIQQRRRGWGVGWIFQWRVPPYRLKSGFSPIDEKPFIGNHTRSVMYTVAIHAAASDPSVSAPIYSIEDDPRGSPLCRRPLTYSIESLWK